MGLRRLSINLFGGKMKGIILTLLIIISNTSNACLNGEYLLPENNLKIPVKIPPVEKRFS